MLKVDSKMLVDSFIYEEYKGFDDVWQTESFADPVTVEKVRIDRSTVYSRDSTQSKIIAESVIFCFASATSPFKDFKEESRVTFDGKQFIIKKVITKKEPFADKVWSYELEVL